jgi:hypothetical protein
VGKQGVGSAPTFTGIGAADDICTDVPGTGFAVIKLQSYMPIE